LGIFYENIDTIAKHCGLSRQKTSRIIKHLEEKGLIWGYTAIFDEEKIGLLHFMVMIKRAMKKIDEKAVDLILSTKTEDIAKNSVSILKAIFLFMVSTIG